MVPPVGHVTAAGKAVGQIGKQPDDGNPHDRGLHQIAARMIGLGHELGARRPPPGIKELHVTPDPSRSAAKTRVSDSMAPLDGP